MPIASVALSRRVGKVVGYPPLCDIGADQRRELQEALLEANCFEDLHGKWQAAILRAEQNREFEKTASALTPALGVSASRSGATRPNTSDV